MSVVFYGNSCTLTLPHLRSDFKRLDCRSGFIEVDSFSFGASNNNPSTGSGGGSAGRVSIGSISVASELLQLAVRGALSSLSCGLYNTQPSSAGEVPNPYLTATLANAVLSSVEVVNNGKGDKQRMKLWFDIDSIVWK
ncbi:MAG: type VI secretion system tube protein Hcp [Steroidobacteraceae bacterium]